MKKLSAKKIVFLLAFCFTCLIAANAVNAVEMTIGQVRVNVTFNARVADTWNKVTYANPTQAEADRYIAMMKTELEKYPPGYLQKARATHLILGKNLKIDGVARAAVPDPYGNRLYLSTNGMAGAGSADYLVHVLHHELNHNAEYAIWNDQYYRWNEWASANRAGFAYGQGGASAYSGGGRDYYTMTHPAPGFGNIYQTLAQEEDRSEIVAWLMHDVERDAFIRLCREDAVIRRKARMINQLLLKLSGARAQDVYWQKANACFAN